LHGVGRLRPILPWRLRILILLLLSETRRRPHGAPGHRDERDGSERKR
jgi:hypothetical protein